MLVKFGVNRKMIIILSGFGTAIAFISLSINFHIDALGKFGLLSGFSFKRKPIASFKGLIDKMHSIWTYTISLTSHILLFNMGYGAIVFPAIAEILPLKHRNKYMSIITTLGGLFGFVNTKTFQDLKAAFGPVATFATYAAINICGAFYVILFFPTLN